ncbi:hypothetical protein PBY51_011796 [Eleginops maclovinus]|uniref:Uncharacterized protein n=1 Tax=Eleginops maclovinus TaxID=56733 RepID=A0AAN7XUV8_ELEMC|nr:hypothetical protein PBY51_011796 [Eleginops maclovinus]
MAAQGRMVMPTVGATVSRGRPTGNKLQNTSFEPGRANFTSYIGHPSGTGFTSNQRPAIFYRPSLDLIDNPRYGLLLSDSFTSQTKQHYQPHIRSDCWGSLPNLINKPRDSGYYQLRIHPKAETVEEKTEYQRLFVPHCQTPKVSQNHMTLSPRGESGFTEGTKLQLNTFQEKSCMVEPLQTHTSVMKKDFVRPSFLQGNEARPSVCNSRFSRETGFNRVAMAPLACPASHLPSPQTKSNAPTAKTIGKKEPTGGLLNASNNSLSLRHLLMVHTITRIIKACSVLKS